MLSTFKPITQIFFFLLMCSHAVFDINRDFAGTLIYTVHAEKNNNPHVSDQPIFSMTVCNLRPILYTQSGSLMLSRWDCEPIQSLRPNTAFD